MLGVFMNTGNDITFVIQGPINTFCIKKSIDKIRTLFQNAKIIVSSFYGADTSGLLADSIILSDDPGCFYYSKKQKEKTNNINRQIVSTCAGLKAAKTRYSFKLRSDFILYNKNFLNYFNLFLDYDQEYKLFSHKVLIPCLFTRNPNFCSFLFHPSDVAAFGVTSDLFDYFNAPLMKIKEAYWDSGNNYFCRYVPEQYLFINFLKKKGEKEHYFHYYNNYTKRNKNDYIKYILSNFTVLNMHQLGIKTDNKNFLLCNNQYSMYNTISHNDFIKEYNHNFNTFIQYKCTYEDKYIKKFRYIIIIRHYIAHKVKRLLSILKIIKSKG